MPDERCSDPTAGEKRLFKGKDAQEALEIPAHCPDSSMAPGPGVRRHQINHRNAHGPQSPGKPKVEIRRIDENRKLRFLDARCRHQPAVLSIDLWNVAKHFD